MENVDWRHLTTGSSGLTGQARSQLNRMLERRLRRGEEKEALPGLWWETPENARLEA